MSNPDVEKLEARIAQSFVLRPPSPEVATLIDELDVAAQHMEERIGQVRERALNPTIIGEGARSARTELSEATFQHDRMKEAKRRLQELLIALKETEKQAKRQADFDAARKVRDDLAKELAEVYPSMSKTLAFLVCRINACDDAIERINSRALPKGATALVPVELVARNLRSFYDGPTSIPRIATEMRLPGFTFDPHARYLWPKGAT